MPGAIAAVRTTAPPRTRIEIAKPGCGAPRNSSMAAGGSGAPEKCTNEVASASTCASTDSPGIANSNSE